MSFFPKITSVSWLMFFKSSKAGSSIIPDTLFTIASQCSSKSDDDFILIEIGQEIDKKEFNDMFKGIKFFDPEFMELEVITPRNKRFLKQSCG